MVAASLVLVPSSPCSPLQVPGLPAGGRVAPLTSAILLLPYYPLSPPRYLDFLLGVVLQNTRALDNARALPRLAGVRIPRGAPYAPETLRLVAMTELRKCLAQVRGRSGGVGVRVWGGGSGGRGGGGWEGGSGGADGSKRGHAEKGIKHP